MREEPFMVLPVEVKTKQNLYEGLDLFIKGDMLEGDNAFYCDRCDKKVDTLKRSTFKKLPNVLFIALK
jgi:ubiquitin C-terminal hydrolase